MTRQRSEGSTIGMRIQSFDPSSVRKGGNFPIIKPLNVRMTSAVIRCWSHVFRRPMLDSQHSRPIPTFRLKNRRTFSQITTRCGSCDEKIRSMSPNNSAQKRRFWARISGTFVLVVCHDPAMKEAERLAMRTYTNERSYACSTSLLYLMYPVGVTL